MKHQVNCSFLKLICCKVGNFGKISKDLSDCDKGNGKTTRSEHLQNSTMLLEPTKCGPRKTTKDSIMCLGSKV